jgi:hypothetical protein
VGDKGGVDGQHRIAKLLLVSAALMAAMSVATVALTTTVAGAASDSVKCGSWNGTYSWSHGKGRSSLYECTYPGTGGGGLCSFNGDGSGAIKWKSEGVAYVTFDLTFTAIMCPGRNAGNELLLSGTVNKSTGRTSKIEHGQALSATACGSTSSFSLLNGTTFDI